ncbi:hypothetical protein FF36_01879 [Frankia torreyi]|uniref:Uncharacterized protein n=1 Tax=Frankia torreyi TaxID=1856 RepID=A0A0D8BI69_9ACTN|nr:MULTISPECIES: hypothetical protein [Frankia]KJE23694.1 hypothetical protein FF36_01879 [Frankia torreyi]
MTGDVWDGDGEDWAAEEEEEAPGPRVRRYDVAREPGGVVPRRLSDLGIRVFTSEGNDEFVACFIPTILYPGDADYEAYDRDLPPEVVAEALPERRARRWRGRGRPR